MATRQNHSGAGAQDSPQGQAGQLRPREGVVPGQLCRPRPNTHGVSRPATTSFLGKLTGALGPTRR